MKNKNTIKKPNVPISPPDRLDLLRSAFIGNVFVLEYSLKYNEVTKYTTELGYFHDMKLIVAAENVEDAVRTLTLWHDDGRPEAIRVTNIGRCVKLPNTGVQP